MPRCKPLPLFFAAWAALWAPAFAFAQAQDGFGAVLDANPQGEQNADATAGRDARLPVPTANQTKQSLAQIKDIFRDEYAAATTPQARLALGKQLLGQAEKTAAPIERWALCSEAMRLAADAGDVDLCFEAIDAAARQFKVEDDLRIEAVTKLGPKAKPQKLEDLARMAFGIAKQAASRGDAGLSQRCLSLATGFAKKSKNAAVLGEISRFQQAMRDEERAAKDRTAATEKLAANPNDPAVCLEVGRYFCFKDNDWERGLPLLAKGADTHLARLAQLELAERGKNGGVITVADAWWAWAESQKAGDRADAMLHASEFYRTALDRTQGLEQARIEKRIKEAAAEPSSTRGRRVPLADVQVWEAKDVLGGYCNDGTIGNEPYTCLGQAWPTGISGHVTGQSGRPSSITYAVPRGAKRLVGKAGIVTPRTVANTDRQPASPQTFEILFDGRSVWKSPPLSRREETADFDIPLMNASRLELRVNSASHGNAWTAWLNPEFAY